MACLSDLETAMRQLQPDAAAARVEFLIGEVERSRRLLSGYESRLVSMARRYAERGDGPDPEDIFTRNGASRHQSRKRAERAKTAEDIPELSEGVDKGETNPENIDAINRASKGFDTVAEEEAFKARGQELADLAAELLPHPFRVELKRIVAEIMDKHGLTLAERQRAKASVRSWTGRDGMRHVHGTFDPEWGDTVTNAIEKEAKSLANSRSNDLGQKLKLTANLSAEALFELCLRAFRPDSQTARPLIGLFLTPNKPGGGSIIKRQVDQHGNPIDNTDVSCTGVSCTDQYDTVGYDTAGHGPANHRTGERDSAGHKANKYGVGEWFAGDPLSPEAAERAWCDADVANIGFDGGGVPLMVGRRYRTATPAQRFALESIYTTCAWKDCDRPFRWTRIRHVLFWENNGPTDLENLVPVCAHHHTKVHEGRWSLRLDPDRALHIYQPNGTLWATTYPTRHPREGQNDPTDTISQANGRRANGSRAAADKTPTNGNRGNGSPANGNRAEADMSPANGSPAAANRAETDTASAGRNGTSSSPGPTADRNGNDRTRAPGRAEGPLMTRDKPVRSAARNEDTPGSPSGEAASNDTAAMGRPASLQPSDGTPVFPPENRLFKTKLLDGETTGTSPP